MTIITQTRTTPVELVDNENLYVSRSGSVFSEVDSAINTAGRNHIEIAGEVMASRYPAISVDGVDNTITVHATGIVTSDNSTGIMVSVSEGTFRLTNYGFIHGNYDDYGVWLNSASDVANHGVIVGGVLMNTNGAVTLRNYGTISGHDWAVNGAGLSDKLVVNAGILDGNVALGFGNDTLDSRTGAVYGVVFGNSGDDRLLLGSTDDTLDGGAGADELVGGGGYDYASYASASGVGVTAYLVAPRLNTGDAFGDTYDGIEGLIGSQHADVLGGDNSANVIRGGGGADTMRGYGGDDRFFVDVAGDSVIEAANGGFDRVFAGATYTLAAAAEVEVLSTLGTATTTVVSLTGNGFDNVMMGNAAGNQLSGLAGADNINGYAGNDRIYGGLGLDTMTGGAGLDNFYFDTALNATSNVDRILDFSHADDTIRLSQTVFTTLLTGVLSADAYRAGAAAADATDRIIYNKATGALFYDRDGAGGAAQIQFAWLPKDLILSGGDFIVY
jgi:Ca2+-binding RTX toxin-like protein